MICVRWSSHVAEVTLELVVDLVLDEPGAQRGDHLGQWTGRALEVGDLTRQLVDPPRHLGIAAEDLDFDLVDVVGQAGDHWVVAVDHLVEDGVEDRLGPASQKLRLALEASADRAELGRLAVADGQHERGTDEHVDLAELDLLRV